MTRTGTGAGAETTLGSEPVIPAGAVGITVAHAANLSAGRTLAILDARAEGLTMAEVADRLSIAGPNSVPERHLGLAHVAITQLRNPLLLLLFVTAALSAAVGEQTNATIIATILLASASLATVNEYRAARASEALATNVSHVVTVCRDGGWALVDATGLVPGDVVRLVLGTLVPADLRLLEVDALSCDESALTGEALPVAKTLRPVPVDSPLSDLSCCALMGTVVRGGRGLGVVVATGAATEFGRIARDLQGAPPQTAFAKGLREFSKLLAVIAFVVSGTVFLINLLLGRDLLDALLFAAAIAVGITPELLPAVVSTSLANGSRELARHKVLVKRLAAIEDLGDLDVLMTDKTGTLTTGQFRLASALDPSGLSSPRPHELGVLATTLDVADDGSVSGDPLDVALWTADPQLRPPPAAQRLAVLPFDHERLRVTVLTTDGTGAPIIVTKGAPEAVLAVCTSVDAAQLRVVKDQLALGGRVIAVASRAAPGARTLTAGDENGLLFDGLLIFDDPAKSGVREALGRLAALEVRVIIASGDSVPAAARLAAAVGLDADDPLSGAAISDMGDEQLATALRHSSVLARVTPEQKARVVRVLHGQGAAVGFLGDGVNDALALHDADVGLSVDTAADVARDAADVVLLEKSLAVVADGITHGRRIFANTIKYVLMGTSSNFGNILSAGAASALLPFLPMLPSQLLLNNLLYDTGQLTIPTDRVDADQLRRPGQWNLQVIRRFMFLFGPLSSLFDFLTFGILLGPFHAHAALFRGGWFVESLATQTLVVYAIRTKQVPFLRSRPSRPLVVSTLAVVAIGAYLPLSPLRHQLRFAAPGLDLYACIAALAVVYVAVVDVAKRAVFTAASSHPPHCKAEGVAP